MTILYNCHTDGDNYRITKFNDGEVESSYLCSTTECQCPAGSRPICRHRLMLPMFLNRGAVDTFWFLDWERKGWVSNEPAPLEIASMVVLPDDVSFDELVNEFDKLLHPNCERSELGSSNLELAVEYTEFGDHTELVVYEGARTGRLKNTKHIEEIDKPRWRRI